MIVEELTYIMSGFVPSKQNSASGKHKDWSKHFNKVSFFHKMNFSDIETTEPAISSLELGKDIPPRPVSDFTYPLQVAYVSFTPLRTECPSPASL